MTCDYGQNCKICFESEYCSFDTGDYSHDELLEYLYNEDNKHTSLKCTKKSYKYLFNKKSSNKFRWNTKQKQFLNKNYKDYPLR